MAPKSKKYTSTPNMKKRQARARPKANVSEPDTATEEVESSTLEIPKGSKDRQSKKMNIKVTSLVHAAATAGVPGANGSGEEDDLFPDGKYTLCNMFLIFLFGNNSYNVTYSKFISFKYSLMWQSESIQIYLFQFY